MPTSGVLSDHWARNGTPQAPDVDVLRTFPSARESSVDSLDRVAESCPNSPVPSSVPSISSSTRKLRAPRNSKKQGRAAKPGQLRHYAHSDQGLYTKAKRIYRVSIFKVDGFPSAAIKAIQAREAFDEATSGKGTTYHLVIP